MRWLFISIAFFCSAAATAAPLDGRWASDKAVCANPDTGDNVPTRYEGNWIYYYESSCEITKMTAIGDQDSAWEVVTQCSGEGEDWESSSIIALVRDGDTGRPRQMIEIDRETGGVAVSQNCDAE